MRATPADWYPDPSNAAQLRYWNGSAWTEHVSPKHAPAATMAGWYPAPEDTAQLRYWNGTMWTDHWAPTHSASPATGQGTTPWSATGHAPADDEFRITMTSAEWQNQVGAWMAAGAIQHELWRRLSHAHISDADQQTLELQQHMEQLTAEQAARRVRLMLEAKPGLYDQLPLAEILMHFFLRPAQLDSYAHVRIDRGIEPGRSS